MQIKDEGALSFLDKLKGDPSKRPRDKYCRFHYDHGHDIANYYDLKQQIEALIRKEGYKGLLARRERIHLKSRLLVGRTKVQDRL